MFPKKPFVPMTQVERNAKRIKDIDEILLKYGSDARVLKPDRKQALTAERDSILKAMLEKK
jgi:hypothetical protein